MSNVGFVHRGHPSTPDCPDCLTAIWVDYSKPGTLLPWLCRECGQLFCTPCRRGIDDVYDRQERV